MNKLILCLGMLLCYASFSFGQGDKIQGSVRDQDGVPLSYSIITLYQDSVIESGAITDTLGKYSSVAPYAPHRRGMDRYIVDMQNSIVAKNKNALQALNYSPGVTVVEITSSR